MPASLDGVPIFGVAVHITPMTNPNSFQRNEFFGLNGVQSLDGGGRGRVFQISGMITAFSPGAVEAAEAAMSIWADGNVHTLVTTTGDVWFNVVFYNEFKPKSKFVYLGGGTWGREYDMILHGLA